MYRVELRFLDWYYVPGKDIAVNEGVRETETTHHYCLKFNKSYNLKHIDLKNAKLWLNNRKLACIHEPWYYMNSLQSL